MEEILFLTIIIFFIINSLEYLLSIYFLVSLFNHKIVEEGELLKQLINCYKNVSASFSFHTIFFLTFVVTIFLIIYKFGLTLEEDDCDNSNDNSSNNSNNNSNNNQQNNTSNISEVDNNNNNNNNNFRLEYNNIEKCFSAEKINVQDSQQKKKITKILNSAKEGEFDRFFKINKIFMTISYLICKFFYLLHLILISVNYNKIKEIYSDTIKDNNNNYENQYLFIIGVYKELMILGYIFFVFFLISSAFAFIMSRQLLKCLNNLNFRKCLFLETYFDKFIKNTPEMLKKNIKKMDEAISKLEKYRDVLKNNLNNNI